MVKKAQKIRTLPIEAQQDTEQDKNNYRSYFENSPIATVIVHIKGNFLNANPEASRFLGYSTKELLRLSISDVVPILKDPKQYTRHFTGLKETGRISLEIDLQHKNGNQLKTALTVVRIEPDRFMVFVEASKQHKLAEEALLESEDKYRALLASLPDIVMRFDRDGRHLFASENVNKVVALESHQFIGKTHKELGFPEAECQFWEDAICGVFDRGTAFENEFILETKGEPKIFDWRLVPEFDARGAVLSVLSVSRDITTQRKIEQKYRTLFRKILDGFALHEIICDEQGNPVDYRFLDVNPAFERMTGLKAEHVVGKTVREILPNTEQHWIKTYGHVALTGEPAFFENSSQELDRHFEVTTFRPAPKQFACIFADVTERKRTEETLMRQQKTITLNNCIANVFLTAPAEDLYADVLDVLLEALDSRYGLFGYIDDTGNLICPSMTRDVWDKCKSADKSIIFPRDIWGGLWGKSLIEKRTLIANKDLQAPKWHIPIQNALATPIMHQNTLIGQFVVANKPGGYDKYDQELLVSAAAQTAPVLNALLEKDRQQ